MKSGYMKKITLLLFLFFSVTISLAQTTTTPDKLWGSLFREVQMKRVFPDNKTFVDCTPKYEPSVILKKYTQEKIKPGATQGYYTAFSQDEAADILLLMRKRQSELISWFLLAYERATKVDACNERL